MRGEIAAYVRDLRERPERRRANVVAIDSAFGRSNAMLQLRIMVARLFYDFLVEEDICDRNPVGRRVFGTEPVDETIASVARHLDALGAQAQLGRPTLHTRCDWLAWTRRWFETSALARSSRTHICHGLIKAGRWLSREHPVRADPATWTRELAAEWVAADDGCSSASCPGR